ncbi:MAG: hypothetical protein FJ286_01585 [Planctomycetes bacterium]|nr:hypothetical protein [Planctomycetota bacterium]
MTLDALDQAFIDRWSTMLAGTDPPPAPVSEVPPPPPAPPVATSAAEEEAADVVGRLLQAAWLDWCAVADEVEAARRRGRRVIAVVACERSAGCTTLVAGLERILTSRGRDVAVTTSTADAAEGPTHGRTIVLVDAGVWFPPGRINRGRLLIATAGCDAAILVRREDRPAPAAWSPALEAIGVEPLGEVVAFARGAVP